MRSRPAVIAARREIRRLRHIVSEPDPFRVGHPADPASLQPTVLTLTGRSVAITRGAPGLLMLAMLDP